MSFASETKNELARLTPEKKCCMLAEIAGFTRMCGSIRLQAGSGGMRMRLVLTTDNPAVARHYIKLFKDYFGVDMEIEVEQGGTLSKGKLYALHVVGEDERMSEQILRETGILMVRAGMNYISDGIYDGIIKTKCCRKSYLRGIFLGAGSITDPEKAYHIEFVCSTEALANDVKKLINSFVDLHAKVVTRKKSYVVYVKESEQIIDILNILKAHGQLLKFEEVRIMKDLRNKTNRITNCDNANMDKTLDAAGRQLGAIRKIEEIKGLGALPDKLEQAARLRLENPDVSLAELAAMSDPPMTKSGLNNRLRKIEEFADKL